MQNITNSIIEKKIGKNVRNSCSSSLFHAAKASKTKITFEAHQI
jgi:hypothetical protein